MTTQNNNKLDTLFNFLKLAPSHEDFSKILDGFLTQDPFKNGKEYLFKKACNDGINYLVEYLLNCEVDATCDNNYGIRWAANNGHHVIVEKLLKQPNVDPAVDYNLPLRCAVFNNHLETVRVLLESDKVNMNETGQVKYCTTIENKSARELARTPEMRTLLEEFKKDPIMDFKKAVDNNDINLVKKMIYNGIDINCDNGYAIRRAIINGNDNMVKYLLTVPNLDLTVNNNEAIHATELFRDCDEKYVRIYNLIQNKLNKNVYCQDTQTTNDLSDEHLLQILRTVSFEKLMQERELVDLFLQRGLLEIYVNDIFFYSCKYGYLDLVQKYRDDNRVDIHANDDIAYRTAIYNNHYDVVTYLYPKFQKVNIICEFLICCIKNNINLVKFFVDKYHIKFDNTSEDMVLTMMLVSDKAYYDILKIMLKLKDVSDFVNNTLIEYLEHKEASEMLYYIAKNHINYLTLTSRMNLVSYGCYFDKPKIVKLALHDDMDFKTVHNIPLKYACYYGNFENVQLLLQNFTCDPYDKTYVKYPELNNQSAIELAEYKGFTKIINYIRRKRPSNKPTLDYLTQKIKNVERKINELEKKLNQ